MHAEFKLAVCLPDEQAHGDRPMKPACLLKFDTRRQDVARHTFVILDRDLHDVEQRYRYNHVYVVRARGRRQCIQMSKTRYCTKTARFLLEAGPYIIQPPRKDVTHSPKQRNHA